MTPKRVRPWKRLLWGVVFTGSNPNDAPILIGESWARDRIRQPADGEPTRPLLFTTRRRALEWCAGRREYWRTRTDVVRKWRVRPVRVRETVEVVEPAKRTRRKG